MTKLVSKHGLEVDECTRVHLVANLCRLQMLLWGRSKEGPNNVDTDVCFID